MTVTRSAAAALFAAALVPATGWGQPQPLGPEFLVGSFTTVGSYAPAIGADGSGNFVVVWHHADYDVMARRFDSAGTPVGPEFRVNAYTLYGQRNPAVLVNSGGDFTIVWERAADYGYGIAGRHFDSAGSPSGDEFWVSTYTLANSLRPAIAAGSAAAMVVWERHDGDGDGVGGRRLDSAGTPLGTEFQVGAPTLLGLAYPDVAAAGDDFVVVWTTIEEFGPEDFKSEITGRRFASDGTPLGSAFQVNAQPQGYQFDPAVAADSAGGFVVAWGNYLGGYNYRVAARRFANDGTPLGADFTVTTRGDYQMHLEATADPSGGFVIAWAGECGYYCYEDAFARRYGTDGAPLGDAFAMNSQEEFRQQFPAVAISADGRLMGAWFDEQVGQVEGRMFATAVSSPICSGGAIATLDSKLKLGKLGLPAGDEKVTLKGKLPFAVGDPAVFDPATDGVQLLIEDVGAANAVLFELSHRTLAVPGGPGCGPDDGWSVNSAATTYLYKNRSGALPPGCAAGSANGLRLVKLKDKRASKGQILYIAKLKDATIASPVVGPLRATLVTSASAAAGLAGACGGQESPSCTVGPDKVQCPAD